ncbi:pectate lyase [Teredinibacter franksiae]|uniref:pectate lyase n=1 Tax=Teredinibacter franksiae TaxID=2761453 RepID=UPI001627C3EB|nr:pectate lyase [Teredinibacter franksiae]
MTRKTIVGITALFVALGFSANAFAAKDYPDGFTKCAQNKGESCSFSGTRQVALGKSGDFVYGTFTGGVTCSSSNFPSNSYPGSAWCSYGPAGSGGDTGGGTDTGGSSSSGTSNSCGSGGGTEVCVSASGGNGSVSLSWNVSGSVTDQQVYRDTDSNPSGRTRLSSVGSNPRSFTDNSASNGTTYYYWIKFRANGTYYNSGVASATPSGSSSGGGSTGGGSSGSYGSSCNGGNTTTVTATIRVEDGGTFDGGCNTYNGGGALGDGSQDEGQDPIFRVGPGLVRNVYIGGNGADGIHTRNGGDVDNVHWSDVGEDAMTIKDPTNGASVYANNIEGYDSADKFLQANDDATWTVNNCRVDNAGKFLRQNGGTTFPLHVDVTNCDISNMGEGIFRSDSSNSTARITNSRLSNSGDTCIGSWSSCSSSGITNY